MGQREVLTVHAFSFLSCYEINRGLSSFNYSLEASLQKRRSLSQSLNYYVHVSAQFLRTNDLVLKFCDDCLAGRFCNM